jgi:hypothetical protein
MVMSPAPIPPRAWPLHQGSLFDRSFDYVPPPGFDPLTASAADLETYGIVPRPDPVTEQVSFRNWLRIFAPPIEFVEPQMTERRALWRLNPRATSPALTQGGGASRFDTSRNWSGAYIVPTDDTMVVLVAGLWAIPELTLPPPAYQQAGATQYVCSTWVGLDGQRRYLNSSLPQAGTMQFMTLSSFAPPHTSALAFFQWWDQETGGTFLQLKGLHVHPGDVMISAVWAKTETRAIAYLRNVTTGKMAIVGATSPIVKLGSGPPVGLTISGATAEWILERPTDPGTGAPYAFPAYSATTFACWAGTAPAGGAGPPQSWHDLLTARFIRMYDTLRNPTRTVFVSMPNREGDTSVQLEYGDFKD